MVGTVLHDAASMELAPFWSRLEPPCLQVRCLPRSPACSS